MVKGGPAVDSLDDALRLLRSSRLTDRKAATDWLGEATNDAKTRAAITKAGRWEEVVAAARHHARDEAAGSGKGGRGGKASSASSATSKQTAAAKFLLTMINRTPTQEAAWPLVPQAEALAKLALVQMAEAGDIPNLQQQREQEAEALRILDAVLKEPKHCEGLSRKIVRQTITQLINGLEDEEEEGGGGGGSGGGAGALTPQSVTRAQCLSTLLANYRRDLVRGGSPEGEEQYVLRSVIRFAGKWAGRHGADEARRAGVNNFPDVAGEVLGAVNALLLKHGVDCAPPLSLGSQEAGESSSYGAALLGLALQCFRHVQHREKEAPTFLEHIRLQLHLARARIAHPQPWHIDARDPVAGNLDKILQLALGDVLTNAGTVAREGTKGGGRRTAAAWIPLKYRDRLALALAAESLCALLASSSSSSSSSAGGGASVHRGASAVSALSTTQHLQSQSLSASSSFTKRRRLLTQGTSLGGAAAAAEADDGDGDGFNAGRACLATIREALLSFAPAGAAGAGGGGGGGAGGDKSSAASSAHLLDASQAPGGAIVTAATSAGAMGGGASASQAPGMFSQRHAGGGGRPAGGFHSRGSSSASVVGASMTQASALPLGASTGTAGASAAAAATSASAGRSGGGLLQTLAHLQLLTAFFEALPAGAEANGALGDAGPGQAVAEWVALLEGVLASRGEGILTLWALAALLAAARRGLGLGCGPRQAAVVRAAWQSVLATLLRRDLPCWGATGRPAPGGVGEGVLRLLVALVGDAPGPGQHRLLASADVARMQDALWSLPVFHDPAAACPWALRLLHALVLRGGEILDGSDGVAAAATASAALALPLPFARSLPHASSRGGGAFADEPLDAEDEAAQAHAALLLLGPPTSRAERLGDFLAGWLQHHIFASRAPLAARARAVTTALRALLDLTGASRYYLPAPSGPVDEEGDGAAAAAAFGPACFAVGALPWGLTSPWRARAEGSNDSHARLPGSGATRLWLGAAGGRDLWREGMAAPAAALGASPDTMRPPIAGLRLPVPATGDGRDDEGEAGEDVMDVDGRGRGRARGAGRQSRGGLPAGRDRICTAGGCPLRRRQGRGGGSQAAAAAAVAASSSSASGSGAAQFGAARRVLAHLDGWVEAFIAALASGSNGAPSAAANDEAVRAALLLLLHCLGCLAAVGLEDGRGLALTLLLPRVLPGGVDDDDEEEDGEDGDENATGEPPGLGAEGAIPTRRFPAHKWANAALSRCLRLAKALPGWALAGAAGGRQRQAEPSKFDAAMWAAHALTAVEELLTALPVTLAAGGQGSVERCGLLVEAPGAEAVAEAAMPTALRELLRFLRFRADAGLELLLPRCVDDNGAASAGGSYEDDGFGSDDDGGGAAGRIAKSQQPGRRRPQPSQDSDSDESMMGDSDDEDRGGSAGGRGRRGGAFGDGDDSVMMVAAGRRGRGRGGGRTPDGTLACALAGGRFALKDLAGWARAALVLCPTHLRAPAFLRAAGGLLQAAEGERVDLPALWRDGLFLLADPEEYVEQLAALHTWVQSAPGGETSSQGRDEDADAAAVHAGQEVRLPLLLRLVSLLADGAAACPWLLEALAVPEVTNRLWATFDLLGASAAQQGELSWYNRALGTAARCSLFRLPALQGDNAQRKAFLINLVSAAKHPDAEVRLAAARALPAVFAAYPNSLGVWDQYRKQGVLVAPGETSEAEESALLGSPSITAPSAPVPLALDRLQRRLGQLLALGAAGRSADRIARVAVLALCRWWAHPAGAPAAATGSAAAAAEAAPAATQRRRGGGGGGGGQHHGSSESALRARAARAVRPLVEALLEDMARGLGYPSAGAAMEEHLAFLMHEWVVVLRLPLGGFPCHLVVAHWRRRRRGGLAGEEEEAAGGKGREEDDEDEEDGEEDSEEVGGVAMLARGVTGDGGAEGGRASAAAALPAFVRATLSVLVRLAAMVEGGADPTYRFELLAALAEAAGAGEAAGGGAMALGPSGSRLGASGSGGLSREARVAGAVAAHMVELKALELLLRTVPSAEAQLTDLRAFLRRSLPRASYAEIEAGLVADYSQDLVLTLLDLLAPEPPPQGPLSSLAPANLRGALRELATRVMGYPDEGEARLLARLWEGCNPAEVLLHLKVRLAEAIRPVHAQRLLELARELLTALGPTALEPAPLHLSIHILLWALERRPEALALPALSLLQDALLDPILAPDSAGSLPCAQRAARLGPHLGTLLVSLYAALARLPSLRHAFAAAAATTGGMHASAASTLPAMPVEEERKVATAVIDALRRLVIDERVLLKPWLAGLDPLPPLAPDAALTTASVLQPPDLHRLEEARHALARAAPLLEGGGDDDQGGSGDDERARATRALLAQARRCAATLSRGGGEGGMAGQVAKLMALQALVARLSPLPNAAAVGGGAVGVGVGGGGAGSSSAEAAMALRFAGAGAAGRELRRVLVPPLLELCRGGGGERGGDGVAMAVKLEAAKALGALGAVPPWELMLWDPYDPTAGAEEAAGGGGGGGGGAGHGGTQGRTRGRSRGQEAQQQAAAGTLPPVQSAIGRGLRILLGLLTGSDAGAVRLSLSTLQGTLLVATGADRVLSVRPWLAATIRCASAGAGGDAAPSPRSAATAPAPAQDGTLFEAQEVDLLLSFARSSTRAAAGAAAAGGAAGEQDGGAGGSLAWLPAWWETQLWDPTALSYEAWISRLVPAVILGINPEGLAEEDDDEEEGDQAGDAAAATSRFLRRCAAACHAVPALAETLLPLALLSLLRTDPPKPARGGGGGGDDMDEDEEEQDDEAFLPPGFASRGGGGKKRRRGGQQQPQQQQSKRRSPPKSREEVAARLARCLRHCLARESPRPLQALLGALTFLRRQTLHEMTNPAASGGHARRRSSGSTLSSGAAPAVVGTDARAAVAGLMGLELDKRLLARAALRCGALTTAALYLELHLEDERQRRSASTRHHPSGAGARRGGGGGGGGPPYDGEAAAAHWRSGEEKALLLDEVDEAPALLLRIAAALADPDAAAGVQAGTGLDGRMRAAAARESPDWAQALAAQDSLALRAQAITPSYAMGAPLLQQPPPLLSAASAASAGAGAATALRKLDLGHVLGAYLQGLQTRADERHAAALRELEYENAWRACRWQSLHGAGAAVSGAAAAVGGGGGGGLLFRWPDPLMARHGPAGGDDEEEEGKWEGRWGAMDGADGAAHLENEDGGTGATAAAAAPPQAPLLRFHERLHAALRALAARDWPVLAGHIASARRGLLTGLARAVPSPSEPARALGPLLARLQCLREVEETAALALRPHLLVALPTASAVEVGTGGGAAAAAAAIPPELSLAVRRSEAVALLAGWQGRSRPAVAGGGGGDFEAMVEPVLALREVLVRALCPPLDARAALVRHARGLAAAARSAGNLTVATSAMDRAESLLLAPGAVRAGALSVHRCACKLEQAKTLWARGESDLAIRLAAALGPSLKELEHKALDHPEPGGRALEVQARRLAGRWMAAARSEGAERIIQDQLLPAVERAKAPIEGNAGSGAGGGAGGSGVLGAGTRQRRRAHLTLANFLADLYQRRSERLRSEEGVQQEALLKTRKQEFETLKREFEACQQHDQTRARNLRSRVVVLERELRLDEAEWRSQTESIAGLLLDALRHFRHAIALEGEEEGEERGGSRGGAGLGDDGDEDEEDGEQGGGRAGPVFRLVALWFEPRNAADARVNQEMAAFAAEVPTHKVVPLIYQILSRLGSGTQEFARAVEALVYRACKEHPFHTLLQLFALKHGKRVRERGAMSAYESIPQLKEKVEAAQNVHDRLLKASTPAWLPGLVQNTGALLEGYMALAHIDKTPWKSTRFPPQGLQFGELPANNPSKARAFPDILRRNQAPGPHAVPAVLTHAPPLDPLRHYEGAAVVRLERFDARFQLATSGNSKPVILVCFGSDGRRYKQVVKPEDVRQDGVMMQVFSTVNALLARDPAARRRALAIRTYRVVPLTPDSGVLEFVCNTKPLSMVLTGSGTASDPGLHARYNPGDLSSGECRARLKNATTFEEQREVYAAICARFRPAFRFFFLERYPDPALWYRRRLHYTRSAAAASIVGYVLGIGDRHATNILLDEATAGIVHIDFGFTFEQGKVLPMPETVPFRLTRDLVDAMGATGTEGAFRQCCNTTMAVLRRHVPSLLTILEVCVHDPLHSWVRAAVAQLDRVGGGEEEDEDEEDEAGGGRDGRRRREARAVTAGGNDAQRALLRIRQKMQGYHDPGGDPMSVDGHVRYLISEATDTNNLCRIFSGWSPYL